MNVLIIEDEPYAQSELKRLLAKVPVASNVIGCLDSIEDAVEWFQENTSPDLLFLDIQLSDGLSFEIFNRVEINTPVVFTTAFDEYAIRAFKVNSIDYLLKPIKLEALTEAMQKYKSLVDHFGGEKKGLDLEQVKNLLEIHKPQFKSRFIAKVGDQIKHVAIQEVAYFKAEDNEVMLVTKENNRYIIDYSLDQLTGLLNPVEFFRVNRAYIVSPLAINKISKYFNSRLHLDLIPAAGENVLISRVKVPEFLEWMDK